MYLGLFGNRIRIHFVPSLRNRVVTKFSGNRVATQQSLRAEPHAAPHAKSLDCFIHVHRTGGRKPAASREEHREIRLVTTKREQRGANRRALPRHAALSSRRKSAASAAKGAFATELFGCMTMSHPAGNSSRCSRAISRRRRRIRLRTTAPPRAFLMLKPKRLCGRLFAFRKTVKWELERRLPAR